MSLELSSFLPNILLEYLAQRNIATASLERSDQPLQVEVEAVSLFADISGFTSLSETLAAKGSRGAEELTKLVNRCFEGLVAVAQRYGGDIANFSGDALLVLFPLNTNNSNSSQSWQEVAWSAVSCALEMQAHTQQFNDAAPYPELASHLTIKIGVGMGRARVISLGGKEGRRVYFVAGKAVEDCLQAEKCAAPGEIWADTKLYLYLVHCGLKLGQESCHDFRQVIELGHLAPLTSWTSVSPLDTNLQSFLQTYLHPVIASLSQSDQKGFIYEHRPVTTLFANFKGDFDSAAANKKAAFSLQAYFDYLLEIVANYGGNLTRIDVGAEGSRFLLLFGTPVSHEDEASRALACAVELQKTSSSFGVTLRIGISSGRVFAGLVGAKLRQEYTVMGDVVNLAARLMQNASFGQILTDADTQRATTHLYEWHELAALKLKGKKSPILAFVLTSPKASNSQSRPTMPVVGRELELELIAQKMALALSGQGQTIGISGEAGIGKSRLVAEVITRALPQGWQVYSGKALSYTTDNHYFPWQNLCNELFGLDTTQTVEQQIAQLTSQLAELNQQWLLKMPLLAALTRLPIPESEFTAGLDAKTRKTVLENLLLDYLAERTRQTPLLLVLEDCHWLDAPSVDLVRVIRQSISRLRLVLILAYRPDEEEQQGLEVAKAATVINLTAFSQDEANLYSEHKLNSIAANLGKAFTEELKNRLKVELFRHSEGHPLFLDELLEFVGQQMPDLADVTQVIESVVWPDNLHHLILSRIDRLDENQKLTLKVASVIGRSFKAAWLPQIFTSVGESSHLEQQLQTLQQNSFVCLQPTQSETEYTFKHVLLRDVAYQSLSYDLRTHLHTQIGDFIEQNYAEQLDQYVELLAYHYGQSPNRDKQIKYYRQAAARANADYALASAFYYYTALLALLQKKPHLNTEPSSEPEQLQILQEIIQLLIYTAKFEQAKEMALQAYALAQKINSGLDKVKIRRLQGEINLNNDDYETALDYLKLARYEYQILMSETATVNRREVDLELVDILKHFALIRLRRGEYEQARATSVEMLDVARTTKDSVAIIKSLNSLASSIIRTGNLVEALAYFKECLDVAQRSGQKILESALLNNLGVVSNNLGDWLAATNYYNESLKIKRILVSKPDIADCLNNLGCCYQNQAEYKQAQHSFLEALVLQRESGNVRRVAYALNNLGLNYQYLGDYQTAEQYLKELLDVAQKLNDEALQIAAWYNLSNTAYYREDYLCSIFYWEQHKKLIREVDKMEKANSLYTLAMICMEQGKLREAARCLCQSSRLRLEIDNKVHLATALSKLGRTLGKLGHYRWAFRCFHESLRLKQEISPKTTAVTLYTMSVMLWNWQKPAVTDISAVDSATPVVLSAIAQFSLQLLGFSSSQLQQTGEAISIQEHREGEQVLAEARLLLDNLEVQAAYHEGQANLTMEQAITHVLSL